MILDLTEEEYELVMELLRERFRDNCIVIDNGEYLDEDIEVFKRSNVLIQGILKKSRP